MKYYIGVDGGGTKTAFALFDENKKMLDTVTGPGSNHENLEAGFDAASEIIWNGLNELCTKAGIALDKISFTLINYGRRNFFTISYICNNGTASLRHTVNFGNFNIIAHSGKDCT